MKNREIVLKKIKEMCWYTRWVPRYRRCGM